MGKDMIKQPHTFCKLVLILTTIVAFATIVDCGAYPYSGKWKSSSEFLVFMNVVGFILSVLFLPMHFFDIHKKITVFPEVGISIILALGCLIAGSVWLGYWNEINSNGLWCDSQNKAGGAFSIINFFLFIANAGLVFLVHKND